MTDDPGLTPVSRPSITRDVAARLFDYLMGGSLTPGGRLPSERKLAEALQVGRSAIRETLAAFEVLGIVDSRPGSGTYLRNQSADLLPMVINWGLKLGQSRTLELVESRAELEVVSARLAAGRAGADDVTRLHAHLDTMAAATSSGDFIDADIAFHLELAGIAGNSVLSDLLHSVRSMLRVWIERAAAEEGTNLSTVREHQRVLDAVADGDPDQAQVAMRAHMTAAGERLKRSLEDTQG